MSVESTPRSVDLPEPFGPSKPTIWPARQSIDTRARARRRPKWRETPCTLTTSKSTSESRKGRRHRSGAAFRRRTARAHAGCDEARPQAGEHDHAGRRERDVARPPRLIRQARDVERQRLARAHRGAGPDDQQLALLGDDPLSAELRRPQIQVARLEREHDELLERRRPLLLEPRDRPAVRQLEPHGHARRPGRERSSDHDAWSVGGRLRRRVLDRRRADGALRKLERQRSADIHRRRAGVENRQHVEDEQLVVAELRNHARLGTEDDGARHCLPAELRRRRVPPKPRRA